MGLREDWDHKYSEKDFKFRSILVIIAIVVMIVKMVIICSFHLLNKLPGHSQIGTWSTSRDLQERIVRPHGEALRLPVISIYVCGFRLYRPCDVEALGFGVRVQRKWHETSRSREHTCPYGSVCIQV